MKLNSQFVGTFFKTHLAKIRWRDTMNYAAAIDDNNPLYFDDERDEGIIAHPMFAVAVTWPVIENIPGFIESNDFPGEILQTQVHFTEYLIFHRPIQPDEELTIKGRIEAILSHRSGTHVVVRFDALDQKQEAVFTEYNGAMLRGVHCENDGKGAEALPDVSGGKDNNPLRWESKITIDPLLPFIYDGCTNIVFPIHTSKKISHQVGLPGIILQGTATLALAARELINREAGGKPTQLKEIYCRFTGMVFPGNKISLKVYGSKLDKNSGHYFFDVFNQQGGKAVSHGYAFIER
jgi:acyl dehydratase